MRAPCRPLRYAVLPEPAADYARALDALPDLDAPGLEVRELHCVAHDDRGRCQAPSPARSGYTQTWWRDRQGELRLHEEPTPPRLRLVRA